VQVGQRRAVHEELHLLTAGHADARRAKLDRLSRSLIDAVNLMRWFDRAGAVLVVSDLGLNTANASGRLVASVMAALGEWEPDAISERTSTALAEKRKQGRAISRPAVVDAMPEVAERISQARASGQTWQRIADGLNADGIPTMRGGSTWRVSAVQSAAGYRRPPPVPKDSVLPALPRRRGRGGSRLTGADVCRFGGAMNWSDDEPARRRGKSS
jgi:hypothetical protein